MSEFSRRYITDDIEFYSHDYRQAAKDKKQGSGGTHIRADFWQKEAKDGNMEQLELYNAMIADGVAPEQARGVLPQDLMTAWTWSGTLGAMAKVCRLRLGQDAQAETRYIAEEIYKHLCTYYPVSAPALVKGC
jgi:thymidylate synthase (FAD)